MTRKIEVFDTTLRDGEQACQEFRTKKSKYIIAEALRELGVDTIEAGFPASSQKDFNDVREIAEKINGPYICGLATTDNKIISRTWDAIKASPKPTVHVFTIMTSEGGLISYGKDPSDIVRASASAVKHARDIMDGRGRIEFSAQNAIRALVESRQDGKAFLAEFIGNLYQAVSEAGADVLNIPDTEGYAHPDHITYAIDLFRQIVPAASDRMLSIHNHNDLGLATATTLKAIDSGVHQVEVTMNGLGERAGNCSLEEVIQNIAIHSDRYDISSNVDRKLLNYVSRIVAEHSGIDVHYNKAVVGENAFRHSSGIHQDGVVKAMNKGKNLYQLCAPEDVGWTGEPHQITARSGKMGVKLRLARLGYDFPDRTIISEIVPIVKSLADEKGVLDNLDLRVIADSLIYDAVNEVEFVDHAINKVLYRAFYEAQVAMNIRGDRKVSNFTPESEYWKGEGPMGSINAVFSAIDSLVGLGEDKPKLVLYEPKNVGTTHKAVAETTIVLSPNGFSGEYGKDTPLWVGRARHEDTIRSGAIAYSQALSRYMANGRG